MNIPMTHTMANTILALKSGARINRIVRRGLVRYRWAPDGRREGELLSRPIVEQLVKFKLVRKEPIDYRQSENYWTYTKHVYRATDFARNFRLPPQEFWIPDEPTP